MNLDPAQATALIRQRRSIFPNLFTDQPISRSVLEEILINATWAPTHRLTQPWRFRVFTGASRKELSDYLGAYYRDHTPAEKFSEIKYKKTVAKPLQSAAVLAICMQRDPAERVPEWEEIAATAMAVQNLWLSCTAHGIGGYWSSPAAMTVGPDLLKLAPGERCLGVFYLGYYREHAALQTRTDLDQVVQWI